MLQTAFGPKIMILLEDPSVIEIMLNPDGRLWVERLGQGCQDTGETLPAGKARQIIELIASETNTICHSEKPRLNAELPGSGHRFEGLLPPVVSNPIFAIRKKAVMIFTLEDYIRQGVMTAQQCHIIETAITDRQSILVVGGTGSGKTTLLNAILNEIAKMGERIVTIEDTLELQCPAENKVALRATEEISMNDLLKSTLRLRPDRIIIGEVRGAEALSLVKAFNTGHPGGATSIHANSCLAALGRLENLILEATPNPQRQTVAEAINLIIHISKTCKGRVIKKMATVTGILAGDYCLEYI